MRCGSDGEVPATFLQGAPLTCRPVSVQLFCDSSRQALGARTQRVPKRPVILAAGLGSVSTGAVRLLARSVLNNGAGPGPSDRETRGSATHATMPVDDGLSLPDINGNAAEEKETENLLGTARTGVTAATNATERSATTKNRISQVMDTFASFDTDMKVGTRQRREQDEFRIFKMKEQLGVLEKNLAAEIKYRQEMNKSIKSWAQEEIDDLKLHCRHEVDEVRVDLEARVEAIKNKISAMEVRFAKDMAEIPVEIEEVSFIAHRVADRGAHSKHVGTCSVGCNLPLGSIKRSHWPTQRRMHALSGKRCSQIY